MIRTTTLGAWQVGRQMAKRWTPFLALVLAVILGRGGMAQAIVQTFCDSVPTQATDWTTSVSLTQFDPSLGTLTNVSLEVFVAGTQTLKVENLDVAPRNVTATGAMTVAIVPPNSVNVQATANNVINPTLAAFDGVIDFAGPSGTQVSGLSNSGSTTASYTPMSDFVGLGVVTMPISAIGTVTATGGGNLVAQVSTVASGQACVHYTYTAASPTPTLTRTITPTVAATATGTGTGTPTPTLTVTGTPPTVTQTPTRTRTLTPTRTLTATRTATPSTNLTVCNEQTLTLQTTPWNSSVSVAKFDPTLGTLMGVELSVSTFIVQDLYIENLDPVPQTVTGTGTGSITATMPSPPNVTASGVNSIGGPLGAYDGVLDFGGASGMQTLGLTAAGSQVRSPYTPVSDFVGPGSVIIPVSGNGTFTASGAGNLVTQVSTKVSATVCASYYYVVPTSTPVHTGTATSTPTHTLSPTISPTPSPALAGLGDFVWHDLNADGVQDPGEPGLANVIVYLRDGTNNIVASTVTNPSGFYQFLNLNPGTYSVLFSGVAGYVFSPQNVGGSITDSNANPSNGVTAPVTLAPGQYNPTIDAGLFLVPTPTRTPTRTFTNTATNGPASTATPTRTWTPTIPLGVVTNTPNMSAPSATPTPFLDVALVVENTANMRTCEVGVYDMIVRNMGTGSRATTSGPVTLTSTLPAGLSFVSGSGTGWACSASGQAVTCLYAPALVPNEVTVLKLSVFVHPSAYPTLRTEARISVAHDGNPQNDYDSDHTTIYQGNCSNGVPTATATPSLDVALVQTKRGNFYTCEVASLDYFVRNMATGSRVSTVGPIVINSTLPPELTYVSGGGAGWTCSADGQDVTCVYVDMLGFGQQTNAYIDVYVRESAYPTVNTTAIVSTPHDSNPQNNPHTISNPVYQGSCGGGASTPTPQPPVSTATRTATPTFSPSPTRTPVVTTMAVAMNASRSVVNGRTAQVSVKLRKVLPPVTVEIELPPEMEPVSLARTGRAAGSERMAGDNIVRFEVGYPGGPLVTSTLKVKAVARNSTGVLKPVPVSALATSPAGTGSVSRTVNIRP